MNDGTDDKPQTPQPEPLADRVRDRDRVHPRRARRQLGRRSFSAPRSRSSSACCGFATWLARTRPVDSAAAHELVGDTPVGRAGRRGGGSTSRRYGRAGFLTLATLGLGGVIGAGVMLPSLGFAVLPSFMGEGVETKDVDLGPISNFPEGTFVITTFTGTPPGRGLASGRPTSATTA